MEPRELIAALSKLQEDLEKEGLTDNWRARKGGLFLMVRLDTAQLEMERVTIKSARYHGKEPRAVLSWSEEKRAAVQEAILLRRAIMKRAAELNKKRKKARADRRKQAT
jgi:hypothetical protein